MRKQKVLFLCTQNSARSQMAEGFLRHLAGDRCEVYSAGIDPTAEIHPCAVEAMREVGIDISEQYPKGLRTYMGKMSFNYLIIVCARAEERCPKTFPGVGTTFSWIFEDPRREEDIPYDSMLERFRKVRDEIELKIRGWLEHPEEDLRKLREERERGSKESPFGRILWPVRRGERPSAIFQTVVSPVTWVNKAISGNALKEAI
jgi:arsenate reductase (thioredoxin)